jgi:stringent starvation protein B
MSEIASLPSTRPYLIRAMHEWCCDNGFTPHLSVALGPGVRVPTEFARDGQITLNVSLDATQGLQLGNDWIEFRARFGGVAREIQVPVGQVLAIYARENGQGMAFPAVEPTGVEAAAPPALRLAPSVATTSDGGDDGGPDAPSPRPTLKRVK